MSNHLITKLKEALFSILPVVIIVLILNFTFTPIPPITIALFLISSAVLVMGITFFTLGVDMSLMPMGEYIGSDLVKSRKLPLILFITFIIGTFITIAEPDLLILASQVNGIPDKVIILAVALGVGLVLIIALLRILLQIKLKHVLAVLYGLIFVLAIFANPELESVAFEAGSVTTGPIMVPFVMALGVGLASIRGDKTSEEDTFGLVAFCLAGPVIAVFILGFFFNPSGGVALSASEINSFMEIFQAFRNNLPLYIMEVFIALLPIVVLFVIFQRKSLRLRKNRLLQLTVGTLYTFVGLVLFLTSVNVGFMPVGSLIGASMVLNDHALWLIPLGLALGYFIVSAEPAVFVLKHQVENVTEGAISAKTMGIGLSIGVSISVALAMVRVLTGVSILYIIIPGYIIALLLSYFVSPLFVAIAFDSGAVASGPLAATFLLPLAIGASEAVGGNPMTDAFGIVSLVALTPVIVILILGLIYKIQMKASDISDTGAFTDSKMIEYDDEGQVN